MDGTLEFYCNSLGGTLWPFNFTPGFGLNKIPKHKGRNTECMDMDKDLVKSPPFFWSFYDDF